MKKIIITIDGYSSCGKSTLAKQLARELNYIFVDSGAMYRAITLYFLRNHIDWHNKAAVKDALKNISIEFIPDMQTGKTDIYLNDENVGAFIRDMVVSENVSEVAAVKEIREFAVVQQKKIGKQKGIVMDGRDIGTTVFPDAEVKIFMTADTAVRVERRYKELHKNNVSVTIDEVKHNLQMRDYMDTNREISPLRKAEDAHFLDTSNLNEEEQLKKALKWVTECLK